MSRILQILSAIFSCFAGLEDCCVLYLKALPLHRFEGLVIGYLARAVTSVPKSSANVGLGVLDGIVQGGSDQSRFIGYLSFRCKDSCDCDEMIDVGGCLSVLSTLATLLIGGKCDGF